jgi:gliding motility-associated-like protein
MRQGKIKIWRINPNEDVRLVLDQSVLTAGTYTLSIQDVSGNVEDPCGNLAIAASFELIFNEPISFNVDITTACNGTNGAFEVNTIEGGQPPYVLFINGTEVAGFNASELSPGTAQLLINDQENCGVTTTIEIPNHDISFLDIPLQDSISCSNTSVDISGIVVVPEQNTQNTWQYLANGENWEPLTYTVLNPTVIASGTYRIIATDSTSGCSATAVLEIQESESGYISLKDIRFPNIITPNGDSDNDVWQPFLDSNRSLVLPSVMDTYNLSIFNRWGELVFDSSTGNGRYWNADGYTEGIYYYEVYYKIECGGVQEGRRHGHFQLVR